MSNNTIAPSCPISFNQQPQRSHRQPASVDINAVPPATNLRTVINAINMINNVVQHITRGTPQVNNIYPAKTEGVPPPTPPKPPKYDDITWRETKRDYHKQKVRNPDAEKGTEQYVEISALSRIQWTEDVTGHKLIYVGHDRIKP